MNIRRKLASSGLWSIAGALVKNLSAMVVFVALARLLTPVDFGTVAFASVFVEVVRVAVVAGIPDALIQRGEWDDDVSSTAFWATMALGTSFFIVLTGIAAPLAYAFYDQSFALVLAALSLLLLVEGISTIHVAKLRREFRYDVIAKRGMMSTLISGLVGVGLAYAGWGVWALVISRLSAAAATSAILWRASSFRPALRASLAHVSEFAGFSTHLFLSQLLGQINRSVPTVLIGSVIGTAAVGQYQVGSRALDLMISLFVGPIQTVAMSAFSQVRRDGGSLAGAYVKLTALTALVACPAFLGLAAVAPDFVSLVFGPQWREASWILVALALGIGPVSLNYFQSAALAAAGRPELNFRAVLIGTVSNALVAAGTVWFGAVMVAVGNTVRQHLSTPISLIFVGRGLGVKPLAPVANVAPIYLAAALMAVAVYALRVTVLGELSVGARLAVSVGVGGVLYAALLALLARRRLGDLAAQLAPVLPAKFKRRTK